MKSVDKIKTNFLRFIARIQSCYSNASTSIYERINGINGLIRVSVHPFEHMNMYLFCMVTGSWFQFLMTSVRARARDARVWNRQWRYVTFSSQRMYKVVASDFFRNKNVATINAMQWLRNEIECGWYHIALNLLWVLTKICRQVPSTIACLYVGTLHLLLLTLCLLISHPNKSWDDDDAFFVLVTRHTTFKTSKALNTHNFGEKEAEFDENKRWDWIASST